MGRKLIKMPSIKLNRHCPLCKHHNGIKLGTLKYALFDDNPLPNEYNVVSCNKCGFVFYDTFLTQKNYDDFYIKCLNSSEYDNRKIDINELDYIENIINILSLHIIDKNSKICDIGCGTGLLLKKLKSIDYNNLYGVDPSLLYVDMLKQEGINAKYGSVLDIPFDEKMDVIIISHVLEHVIDIQSSLKYIRSKLSGNGIVYVEVPDAISYDSIKDKNIDISPIKYFYLQHVVHFDKFHLTNLFENNGYREIVSGYSLRLREDLQIPCIWGIFSKNINKEMINIKEEIKQNFFLSFKIISWFNNINLDNNNILSDLVISKKAIYIWGIGIHMKMLLSMSPLKDCNIKYLIDSNEKYYDKTIDNKKIHSPDILYNATKNDVIIICTVTHLEDMLNYLIDEVKFKGEIIMCNFGIVEKYEKGNFFY